MKPFRFQKFTVNQSKAVFRVGTDGVLLGAFCAVGNADSVLEVGTGTGLISMMMAQRNPTAKISAIDIDENAARLAGENFQNCPFSKRLEVFHENFKEWQTEQKFDLIVSNPPYFAENDSVKDVLARQKKTLDFNGLIEKSKNLLSKNGILSVIIPFQESAHFQKICHENNLFLQRKINIAGIKDAPPKRVILEFALVPVKVIETDFIIEKFPRVYSEEYLELTRAFHLFKTTD